MAPAAPRKSPARKRPATKKTAAPAAKKPVLKIARPGDAPVGGDKFAHLSPTDDPEVFMNAAGFAVDKNGVLVSLRKSLATAEAILADELIGGPVDTPAKLLKLVALDPSRPMMMRLDAAKAAAPYFDRKTPVAIESTNNDRSLDMAAIAKLPREKRVELLKTLAELGVDLAPTAKKPV